MIAVLNWTINHWLEVFGALAGLLYLYLSIKKNIWLWVLGFISSAVYVVVYFQSKFYADMSLQFYYLVVSAYGWISWKKEEQTIENRNLDIRISNSKDWFVFLLASVLLSIILGVILQKFTDSPIPYWDGFTTGASIVATWMLTKKYIENWLFWIVIDFVSLSLYIYKGLYATAILFTVFTIFAFVGYLSWKKNLQPQIKTA